MKHHVTSGILAFLWGTLGVLAAVRGDALFVFLCLLNAVAQVWLGFKLSDHVGGGR